MRRVLAIAIVLALAACQQAAPPETAQVPAAPAATPPASAEPAAGTHKFDPAITGADFAEHVRVLASDEFEGRAPGSLGERLTVTYLENEFRRMGLQPGNGDSYVQNVPMVKTQVDPASTLSFDVGETLQSPKFADDMAIGTATAQAEVTVRASDVVFLGYGVKAPEQAWDDYAGVDMKGKTAIVLVNDPGFQRKDPELFKGPAMTYYGRWTYKFEECARQGVSACLIVHDTEAAGYGWEVVRNGWVGAQFDLPMSEDPDPRAPVEGWITHETAVQLFKASGLDFDALRLQAEQRGFKAVPLEAKASVSLRSTVAQGSSDNVLAVLPGTTRKDEAVVFMGHWDHLGVGPEGSGDDRIFNGAIDNATGVAAALEIAGAFAASEQKPERSVLFLIPTLEESGLLGSRWYAAHPVFAPVKTAGVVNMDAMPIGPRSRDMTVIGYGQSDFDALLADVLKGQDRGPKPEVEPEKGYYFRSDHFNFARIGVPALYSRGGYDLREGGVEAGTARAHDYTANRYHKPSDQFDPAWQYDGIIEDVQALYEVGRRVASGAATPQWSADSEFRAAREASQKD
jgi:Zn-dependent M28 family amino/carboxypeptidase